MWDGRSERALRSGERWLWRYKTPRCMLPMNITPPTKAVRRKCPLAIPVPRGPYRLGAHAPGRPRGRAPRRPDRVCDFSPGHRSSSPMSSPGLGVGQRRPESHVPCDGAAAAHTPSHPANTFASGPNPIPNVAQGARDSRTSSATKNHSMHSGVGPGRQEGNAPEDVEDGHRLLEVGKASAPRGRQGIGS
jgi:hypothetical protein